MNETYPTVSIFNKLTTAYAKTLCKAIDLTAKVSGIGNDMVGKAIDFVVKISRTGDSVNRFLYFFWQKSEKLRPILRQEAYLYYSENDVLYTWDRANTINAYRWYNDVADWEIVRKKETVLGVPRDWYEAYTMCRAWHKEVYW